MFEHAIAHPDKVEPEVFAAELEDLASSVNPTKQGESEHDNYWYLPKCSLLWATEYRLF